MLEDGSHIKLEGEKRIGRRRVCAAMMTAHEVVLHCLHVCINPS